MTSGTRTLAIFTMIKTKLNFGEEKGIPASQSRQACVWGGDIALEQLARLTYALSVLVAML